MKKKVQFIREIIWAFDIIRLLRNPNLYYTLNPTRRLGQFLATGEDPKEAIKEIEIEEKDYISGLDEVAKGIDSGIHDLAHGVGSLLFTGTDLIANTEFLSKFEE